MLRHWQQLLRLAKAMLGQLSSNPQELAQCLHQHLPRRRQHQPIPSRRQHQRQHQRYSR